MSTIIPKKQKNVFLLILFLALLAAGLLAVQKHTAAQKHSPLRLYPLNIGNAYLEVELAVTSGEKYRGLSFRSKLPKNRGMLFAFDKPDKYSFFMRDMNFPLDIIWIDENYKISEIMRNLPIDSPTNAYVPKSPIKYVLEVNAGWSQKNKIKVGQTVPIGKILSKESVLYDVPFTPQAPLGNWKDKRQAAGCEEAAALMAMLWVQGKNLNPKQAEREIISISEYELKNYGQFIDTSASDTAQIIIKGFFGYDNFEVRKNVNTEDIKNELKKGNIIIVPVNGKKLKNPFYTPPGPLQHQLLIVGYNAEKKEFIVNDSGTKRGKNYPYKEKVLENALQDYPSGIHKPIQRTNKVMVVVKSRS